MSRVDPVSIANPLELLARAVRLTTGGVFGNLVDS